MMTYEEIYRLKIQPEGEDKVRALEAALRSEQAALNSLTASGVASGAAWKAQTKAVEDLEKQLTRLKVNLETGFKGNASGLMQIGYFLDDIQYGMKGVANNIPGLLQAVGVAGKLAGTLSIVSAAAVLLYGQWDNLMGLFGMGGTKTEAERMEELGKKTEKTAEETAKLLKYQENLSNQQAQRGKSKAEKELADDVNSAVTELGDENAVRGLAQLRRDRYVNGDPETAKLDAERKRLEKKVEQVRQLGYKAPEALRNQLDGVNAKIEDNVDKAARKDLAAAASDPAKAKALRDLVAKNPGAFGPGGAQFAENLGKRDREAADAAWERDAKAQDKEDKEANDMAEAANMDRIDGEIDATDATDAANLAKFKKGRAKKFQASKDSGLGPLITEMLADAIKHGGDVEGLKKKLGEGLTAKFGLAAGPALLHDAEGDAKRKVMKDFIDGEKENKSRTVGGGDWARSIQSGVTNSRKDELARLERIHQVLAQQLELQKKQAQAPPAPATGRAMVFK